MISRTIPGRIALLMLATGVSMMSTAAVRAQALPPDENPQAEAAASGADAAEVGELDWSLLGANASVLTTVPAPKTLPPKPPAGAGLSWSSSDKANGVADVSVKQALSPFWDTRIGADMTVVHQHETLTSADLLRRKFSPDAPPLQSTGTAWAAVTAPGVGSIWDKTAIEARIDPAQEQSKLGTSLSKSLPLGERYSLTLQNGYYVIQQGMVPVPGIAARPVRDYRTEQVAKLSIADTGTSFTTGQSLSSSEDKWLHKVGAEQKLPGGVTIAGSVGETTLGFLNTSITAAFKRSW